MKKSKSLIALLLIAIIGVVGLTIAYFFNSTTIENNFITKEYGSTYIEEFVSPDNWLPGDTTDKTIEVENTGQVDQAVRIKVTETWTTHNNGTLNGWIHPDGIKSNHETNTELETDERVAIINLANTSDWIKVGDYYYYNYKLAPTESTSSFLESVTFNPKTKLDDTCTTTTNNGVTTVNCNSSGDDYDNATYTLTLTIETVQYNQYANVWDNVNISSNSKPIIVFGLNVNERDKNYEDGNKHQMFVFNHPVTEQTPSLTDYRYIGNDPYNYVFFNCDSLNNQQTSTCEIWRILGVFNVDNGEGKFEQRIKIVRGYTLPNSMSWDTKDSDRCNGCGKNDWIESEMNDFLNNDYFNRTGNAETFGLKETARSMVDEVKYYLGGIKYQYNQDITSDELYLWERGTTVYNGRPTEWTGKIALMYPSDEFLVYGKGINDYCYNQTNKCHTGYAPLGWVFKSNKVNQTEGYKSIWFLSSNAYDSSDVIDAGPNINRGTAYSYSLNTGYVRPSLYLKPEVQIIDGDGSSGNPYKLSL